ncbi:MAG: hypothetical protein ACOC03_05420, partial [Desulfosalsimonas sp.]
HSGSKKYSKISTGLLPSQQVDFLCDYFEKDMHTCLRIDFMAINSNDSEYKNMIAGNNISFTHGAGKRYQHIEKIQR